MNTRSLRIMQKLNESIKAYPAPCDVIITVDNEQFFCHRVILMESIPYFEKMFRSGFKESSENVITLKNLDAKAFAAILKLVYIGELKLPLPEDLAGALNVMTVCDYLGMADALDKCLHSFRSYLNSDNVFDVHACIAKTGFNNAENLSKIVYNFILENFPVIYRSERFQSMPYSVLGQVLKDDLVNATEKDILLAIDKWVSYDERNRLKFVNQLADAVRIPYLYSLSGIGDNRSNTTRTLLNRVRSLQARMCNNPAIPEVGDEVNLVAVPSPVNKRAYKSIYFFCHRELENILDVVRYNGTSLESVPSMSLENYEKRYNQIEVVKLGSKFYSYIADPSYKIRFSYFNNTDQCWLPLRNPPSVPSELVNHFLYSQEVNMVSLNSLHCVYLNYFKLMRYIPKLDVWLNAPMYPDGFRNTSKLAADDDNNVIYAFGETDRKKPSSIMLDVRVGKWSKIAPLPTVMRCPAAAYTENEIFVTGSCGSFVYNVRSNSWDSLPRDADTVRGNYLPLFVNNLCYVGEEPTVMRRPEAAYGFNNFNECISFGYNVRSNCSDNLPRCAVAMRGNYLLPFENHLWAVDEDRMATYSLRDRHWSSVEPAIEAKLGHFIHAAAVD